MVDVFQSSYYLYIGKGKEMMMIFNYHTIYIKEKEKKMNNDFFQSSYYLYIGKEMMIDIV